MIQSPQPCPLPHDALLNRYGPSTGGYADSFYIEVPGRVSLPQFVEAFYSSGALKPELVLLKLLFKREGSADLAGRLARGETADFSAWRLEDRTEDQVLMQEMISNTTRSWLKVEPLAADGTRLYFGSAVLPTRRKGDAAPQMGLMFKALLGFHRLYSRILLLGAARRLENT